MKNYQLPQIIESTSHMLQLILDDEVPSPFDENENYTKQYQRVIEIQAEQCTAIYYLYKQGLYRPAYAVLRSILETISTLIWVSLKVERYSSLFSAGNQPNMKEILTRIGWVQEYDRTFGYLSGFVHIDMENAEFYREYLLGGDSSQPFPEIFPDAEYYIVGTDEGPRPLTIKLMSREEAERRYGPYLAAKTFDIFAAGVQRLYGSRYCEKNWWQIETANLFTNLVDAQPELKQKMLWSAQPRLL